MIEGYPSEQSSLRRTPWITLGEKRLLSTVWIVSYGLGLCLVLAIAYRLPSFLMFPSLVGLAIVAFAGLAACLLFRGLLTLVLYALTPVLFLKRLVWLAAVVLSSSFIAAAVDLPFLQLPTNHTITIEALPAQNPIGLNLIDTRILEVRGPNGQVIQPDLFGQQGGWQVLGQGFQRKSQSPAKLAYTFQGPDGNLDILLAKGPRGGLIRVTADGATQQAVLSGFGNDQVFLSIPMQSTRRMALLLKFASEMALVTLIALPLFTLPFYALRFFTFPHITVSVSESRYQLAFFIVFLILLMAPLFTSIGNISTLDKKFWGREALLRGWADFRDRIMGDRAFNSFLMGDNHWFNVHRRPEPG